MPTDNQSRSGSLVDGQTKIIVGDSHYGGSVPRRYLVGRLQSAGCWLRLTRPRPTKVLAGWQLKLLRMRPRVEAVFGLLKERFALVTHYPRSQAGYLAHYLRCLPGYQLGLIS